MSSTVKLDFVSSLIDVLELIPCIDVGCICGLTSTEKSNPIGRVIELNSNGKVRQGFG